MNNEAKQKNRSGGRGHIKYLCIGFSDIKKEKIYNIIQKLLESNGITWLRTRMSYHMFPILEELLQGYVVSKLIRHLASKDFTDR